MSKNANRGFSSFFKSFGAFVGYFMMQTCNSSLKALSPVELTAILPLDLTILVKTMSFRGILQSTE